MIVLDGKRILVTGGASGIGLGIARVLAAAGARVIVNDIDGTAAARAAAEIGRGTIPIAGDVSDATAAADIVAAAAADGLDALVNNAGIPEPLRRIAEQQPDNWQRVMDVNLRGAWLMSRAASNPLARRGGSIINIVSIAGLAGFPASHAYGVSKAALVMLTKTLACELARFDIRVNAVAPGVIDAPMLYHMSPSEEDIAATRSRVPLGRLGRSEDIGNAVAFLCSPLASYISGVVLPVDGGWLAFGGVGPASVQKQPACS